jgi:hypothetical protein
MWSVPVRKILEKTVAFGRYVASGSHLLSDDPVGYSGNPAARSASPSEAASGAEQSTPENCRLYRNPGCNSKTRAAAVLASSSRPTLASAAPFGIVAPAVEDWVETLIEMKGVGKTNTGTGKSIGSSQMPSPPGLKSSIEYFAMSVAATTNLGECRAVRYCRAGSRGPGTNSHRDEGSRQNRTDDSRGLRSQLRGGLKRRFCVKP